MVDAPNVPMPPASLTAATRRWYDTPPIPASITGCSTSSTSVSRVRIRRSSPRLDRPVKSAVEPRAGAGEHAAAPPARGGEDRPRVVLEQPAGEVFAGPGGGPGEPHREPIALAVAQRAREHARHAMVRDERRARRPLVGGSGS